MAGYAAEISQNHAKLLLFLQFYMAGKAMDWCKVLLFLMLDFEVSFCTGDVIYA